jgi:hypothetical protein
MIKNGEEMPDMKDYKSWTVAFQPMNIWECAHPGCPTKAVGMGGAIGLRAIGWHFKIGDKIFCPIHRPDATAPSQDHKVCQLFQTGILSDRVIDPITPCSTCRAEAEAMDLQKHIIATLVDEKS